MHFWKSAWKKWLVIAQIIGNFQAQVILTAFYLVIMAPLGIASRVFGDFLRIKPRRARSNFGKWDHSRETLETARKQY
ncbi:hypothetical protein HYW40_01740 [Candidatus Curtissbacteria bacterium]|nr:hypothetical protein [Candidatus Curtissbacteria bacterium]